MPTRTVFVQHHAELTSSALLVAALNGARLDAALAPPRSAGKRKGHWLPPWHGELGLLISLNLRLPGALPSRRSVAIFDSRGLPLHLRLFRAASPAWAPLCLEYFAKF